MTLSELSNEECSRWIAEKMDPGHRNRRTLGPYWTKRYVPDPHYPNRRLTELIPRDMVNDPAITMMLEEKMPYVRVERIPLTRSWSVRLDWVKNSAAVVNAHRGRAVVEAFMLATGWTE